LLVADLLHPIDGFAVELLLNGDVRHGLGESRAMPVLLTGRKPDHIAGIYFLDRPVLALYPTAPGLPQRMRVPRGARARRERNARTDGACRIVRLKERVNADNAGKPLGRSFGRRLRANPFIP